jgi:prephenate dehydratase
MFQPTILNIKAIPPLASISTIQAAFEQVKKTQNTMASVVVMMLISGPVQQILSSFRHTQITVHIMLIAVNQPASALVFFGGLMNLVNF